MEINKKKCYKCKWFRELYWENGIKSGWGRCAHPEKKWMHVKTGRYKRDTCEHWKIDFAKVGLKSE